MFEKEKEMWNKVFGIRPKLSIEEKRGIQIQIISAMLDEDEVLRNIIRLYLK